MRSFKSFACDTRPPSFPEPRQSGSFIIPRTATAYRRRVSFQARSYSRSCMPSSRHPSPETA
ncbi:hypothetical protein, partial [Sphingopyxis sp.]|uniref:hypothetical protein n=1 Tax=Sphingopyxis sp. TaxID=1908224 RepID=UPI002ED8BC6B